MDFATASCDHCQWSGGSSANVERIYASQKSQSCHQNSGLLETIELFISGGVLISFFPSFLGNISRIPLSKNDQKSQSCDSHPKYLEDGPRQEGFGKIVPRKWKISVCSISYVFSFQNDDITFCFFIHFFSFRNIIICQSAVRRWLARKIYLKKLKKKQEKDEMDKKTHTMENR